MKKSKAERPQTPKKRLSFSSIQKYIPLYIMLAPGLLFVFVFSYCTMPGVLMAFKDFNMFRGFWGSPWVGFQHFQNIFSTPAFSGAILNTLTISILRHLLDTPVPIIFALLLNEVRAPRYKRVVQTMSYLPHFLSTMAIIGMSHALFSTYGIINDVRVAMFGEGTERVKFLAEQWFFLPNIIGTQIWAGFGWNSIVYLSAITGIDPELYEAASVDGANRFKQCLHITIPSILPTFVMLFIMGIGTLLKDSFDLIYGLQNAFIDFETISTTVYKQGIVAGKYSVSTALGLFQGVVGLTLVIIANKISKRVNDIALW